MSLFPLRRRIVAACFAGCLFGLSLGLTCGGDPPLNPAVLPGNRPPRIVITGITTPSGGTLAEQGDPVTIAFAGEDGEDTCTVRVFASTSQTPTPAQEITVLAGWALGPGAGTGVAIWNTATAVVGTYYVFAEIDDRTYDAAAGTGNPPVRVAAASPLLIAPAGTAPENGAPTIQIQLPNADAGVSDKSILTLRYTVKDPNSDEDTINLTYYLDKDRTPANDATEPPIEVGDFTIAAGTVPPDVLAQVQFELEIKLDQIPVRRDVDEGDRPLPYYVRVRADDGNGGIVDQYAVGAVRVLAAASDVVDLRNVGGVTAGAIFQGFYGFPDNPAFGGRAGSCFTPLGDLDLDGLPDFAIGSQTASPENQLGVGETYIIYGRQRTVNPDSPNFQYAQGRYAGINNLNTVGTFVPFLPTDPRYNTLFNIRGTRLPGQPYGGLAGGLGVESLAVMPDVTGDGLPELLIGLPFSDGITDFEDDDPCDLCTFEEDNWPPFACYPQQQFQQAEGEVEGIGTVGALQWAPFNPAGGVPFSYQNCELELESVRVVSVRSFGIFIEGQRIDGSGDDFTVNIKIDSDNGPFVEDIGVDVTGAPGETERPFTAFIPFPLNEFPLDPNQSMSPSVYDGKFAVFIRPSAAVTFESITVQADVLVATTEEEHAIRYIYFDSFPNRYSDSPGCGALTPAPADPVAIGELEPKCPPVNRTSFPMNETYFTPQGTARTFGNRDGWLCNELNIFGGGEGLANDNLGPPGRPYQSGITYVCGSDQLSLPINPDNGQWSGVGQRLAGLIRFGQPVGGRMQGARFRGAWYGEHRAYDPRSLFGYTVAVMPDISPTIGTNSEVLISAPSSGRDFTPDPEDLSAQLGGTYNHDGGLTVATTAFDFGVQFNRVTQANVAIKGTATNLPRMRIGLDDGTGHADPAFSRTVLFWNGAGPAGGTDEDPPLYFDDIYNDTVQFTTGQGLIVVLPEAALSQLLNGTGTLVMELLDDCVVNDASVELTSVVLNLRGLESNTGSVTIIASSDYTRNNELAWCALVTDGDQEGDDDRPMSWPSFTCDENGARPLCRPNETARMFGEKRGDSFGWAHWAGDFNLDGVADIACGAPGSDNNPNVPPGDLHCGDEVDTLTDNGKVYFMYGTTTFGTGRPCEYTSGRFEVRGTHDDDQFGRVQGYAGDVNGDGNDDVFLAAENYDALGSLGGVPDIGVNCGFVGVLFGRPPATAEKAIPAEQIGTGNYPGCKFVGAMAGARLSGGVPANSDFAFATQRGQHGVTGVGDYNLDGLADLLITAPGQIWPGARLKFNGPVSDGQTVTINGNIFEFDLNGAVGAGRIRVALTSSAADAAEIALLGALEITPVEQLGISAVVSKRNFPDPLPDIPTLSFLARRWNVFGVSTTAGNIAVENFVRLGVTYLVFGDQALLTNKVFLLPDDLNRRNASGNRVLKGIVFVSAYERDSGAGDSTPDEAPIEAVSAIGDIDGDGYLDIILGAPQADFINILSPDQRRQAVGEAYVIYGNDFGLNRASQP